MALVKCRECGKEISSSAASCPNCGKRQTSLGTKLVVVMTLVVAFIVMLGMCINSSTTNRIGCIDTATAKPALDDAASKLDDGVRAAKRGDTTTAAAHIRSAAESLRTAA